MNAETYRKLVYRKLLKYQAQHIDGDVLCNKARVDSRNFETSACSYTLKQVILSMGR